MKGFVKVIIAGAIILGIGIAIVIIFGGINNWDFHPEFETKNFSAENEVHTLKIHCNIGPMTVEYYDGDKVYIEYPTSEKYTTSINEKEGTLEFDGLNRNWYFISFGPFNIPSTKIYIPQSTVVTLDTEMNAGKLTIYSGNYNSMKLKLNAGSVDVKNVKCYDSEIDVNAGSLSVDRITCEKITCDLSAGSIHLKECVSSDISLDVSAGSLSLNVIGNEEEYTISSDVSAGSCNLVNRTGTTSKKLTAEVSAGSINVKFSA